MMLRRFNNYLRTLDESDKIKFFIFSIFFIVVFLGGISYYSYKMYKKSENLFFTRLNDYKELTYLLSEVKKLQEKRPKLDNILIQNIVSESGLANYNPSIVSVMFYGKTAYEIVLEQINGELAMAFLKKLYQNKVYLLKFDIKKLPTTGNYNVKVIVY